MPNFWESGRGGNALYRKIVLDYIDRSTAAKAIRDSDYLQIVTMEPDAIVPLEFIYDYALPRRTPRCARTPSRR